MFLKKLLGLFILIILFGVILSLPFNCLSQEVLKPTVAAHINESSLAADVGPGDNSTVRFTGFVTCEISPVASYDEVSVDIDAKVGGWPWTFNPSKMTFKKNGSVKVDFTLDIRAPPSTFAVVEQLVIVLGNVYYGEGKLLCFVTPAEALITINQFYAARPDRQ